MAPPSAVSASVPARMDVSSTEADVAVRGECFRRREEPGCAASTRDLDLEFGESAEPERTRGANHRRRRNAGTGGNLGGRACSDKQRIGEQEIDNFRLACGEIAASGLNAADPLLQALLAL